MARMKYGELIVEYNAGGINSELDDALREVLKKYGYQWWASGTSHLGIRDMAFELEKNEAR